MKIFKKNLLINILLILSIFFVLTIIYIKFFSENINIKPFGIEILKVESNSMAPNFNKEDLIIIKEEKEYEVGDIITFKTLDGIYVTHRIIEKDENGFITKGDNNNTKDDEKVTKEQICGKVVFILK